MAKQLARPGAVKTGITTKRDDKNTEELTKKREEARKMAQEKARARTMARQQSIAEKLASAVEEMTSSLEQAAGAAEELGKTMESVATASEEASAAAEESRSALTEINRTAELSDERAKAGLDKGKNLQLLLKQTASDIAALVRGVQESAKGNVESTKLIRELEKNSDQIGEIVGAVVRIADQTNLLALNAAIEAARAGEHGRGFAVVADEVRNLAETSESSAREIRNVVDDIQEQVQQVVEEIETSTKSALDEVEKAKTITKDLDQILTDVEEIVEDSEDIARNSADVIDISEDFTRGSEDVASNAEEQGSAAEEASKGVQQQNKAFDEMQGASEELAELTDSLRSSVDSQKSAEDCAAAAEELSANIEEATSSSAQIMTALEQISKGAQSQSKAADANKDLGEKLELALNTMCERAKGSEEKINVIKDVVGNNKINVDNLIANIGKSSESASQSVDSVRVLDERTNNINKIVDKIVNVALQTNMLAVNGSIEAARAGEFGRGFSVVASDIRTLANDSSENAEKIKDMVRAMQNHINVVANDLEMAGKIAAQEVASAKKTTDNLDTIEADMIEIQDGIIETNQGASEALLSLEQANKAVVEIANAAEEASRVSEEASSAAEQGSKGMQLIAQAIEDIASQADEMQNIG